MSCYCGQANCPECGYCDDPSSWRYTGERDSDEQTRYRKKPDRDIRVGDIIQWTNFRNMSLGYIEKHDSENDIFYFRWVPGNGALIKWDRNTIENKLDDGAFKWIQRKTRS